MADGHSPLAGRAGRSRQSETVDLLATPLASPFGELRLWLVNADGFDEPEADADDGWLSASEHARARKFVFRRHARRYRAAHVALRRLLWQQCGVPPRTEFEIGLHGKPGLRSPTTCGFNMAHSEAYALIGIGEGDGIGVDLEVLRQIDDVWALAEGNLSAGELDELRRLPPDEVGRGFLTGWTRKEACLKALGSGLSIAPKSLHVGLSSCPGRVTVEVDSGSTEVWVRDVSAGKDILAAVARIARHP